MSVRTCISAVIAFAALLLVALAPTGAAAHGNMPHAHGQKHASHAATVGTIADTVQTELRTQPPATPDNLADSVCGDRGCCSAGHCSGCGTAIAPSSWTCLRLSSHARLLNPDAMPPAGLAREGPARPPKSFA